MQADQPFQFSEDKKLYSKPICWTNNPANLSRKLKMPVKTIEETQKTLLYQSLLNSTPVRPYFLQEYEQELIKTVLYIRNLEKVPVYMDEIKVGFNYLTTEIDAYHINDKVDEDATKRVDTQTEDG